MNEDQCGGEIVSKGGLNHLSDINSQQTQRLEEDRGMEDPSQPGRGQVCVTATMNTFSLSDWRC